MTPFKTVLERILASRSLDAELVGDAFHAVLSGAWTPVQVAAFAVAVRSRGETPEALLAAARALRSHMQTVEHGLPLVADTCGTGGDGRQTLNVSTAAALVVAACGVPVAKHGNRSISSHCGSADVVEALGIPLDLPAEKQVTLLREAHIAFLFAPSYHPALKHAAQARRDLGVRTIFNALGPIANPARATHQVVGVYDDALRPMIATVLAALGTERAWVVHSEDGLDELSPAAPTRVSEVEDGAVRERTVSSADFGLAPASMPGLLGGDPAHNAFSIETILRGDPHPARDTVVINAAAMLWLCRRGADLREAAALAKDAIASGATWKTLERWRALAGQSP